MKEFEGVGVTEHLDDFVPLSAVYTDDRGRRMRLSDFFKEGKPVVLSMNYSSCPLLCSQQLNGLVDCLKKIDLLTGKDFEIVSVSIDPLETTARARDTQQKYTKLYGRPGSGQGWHFLTGEQSEITRLSEAIGFKYRFVPQQQEYAHAAVFVICTPDGRISRYLYGVAFDSQTVRLSLVEAADGKIGTTMDQVLLMCFAYNPTAGSYSPTIIGLMKVAAGATIGGLLLCLIPAWLRRRPKKTSQDSESTAFTAV
ncbi:MAG: SCO family protein [Fuerstiella sp.]